jgi:hypothetical protein
MKEQGDVRDEGAERRDEVYRSKGEPEAVQI